MDDSELTAIGARHSSPDVERLIAEVRRLKTFERLVYELMAVPSVRPVIEDRLKRALSHADHAETKDMANSAE